MGNRYWGWVAGIAIPAALIGLLLLIVAYTPVKYGTVALPTRFGRLTGRVWEPGFHMKTPIVMGVVRLPTQVRSYETSAHPGESKADFTDYPVTAQTVDGQQVEIKYTVVFKVPEDGALNVANNVGNLNQIVENVVKARSRNLARLKAQSYEAEGLYSGDGIVDYQNDVAGELGETFARYGVGLDGFLVRKIDFDENYVSAIENQQIEQENIETARFKAERAEFEKEKAITEAEAEKQRDILLAEADAQAIIVKGEALKKNPRVIQWEFVRNLNNVQWGIMPSDGVTPLIPIPNDSE